MIRPLVLALFAGAAFAGCCGDPAPAPAPKEDPAPTAAAPAFPDISKADLDTVIASGKVTLIDVNGSESYKSGHIPGAIDFAAKKDDLAKLLPADKGALVVAYCGGVKCGAWKAGAEAAKKLGYTNVKHFAEGISGWKSAGGKTEAAN